MSSIEAKIRAISKWEADAKALKAQADELRAELREELEVGDHKVGDFEVTVSTNRRFNAKKAMAILEELDVDDDIYSRLTVDAPNQKAIQALYPEVYEKCVDDGALRITIKEADILD